VGISWTPAAVERIEQEGEVSKFQGFKVKSRNKSNYKGLRRETDCFPGQRRKASARDLGHLALFELHNFETLKPAKL
jgi:hypothetical protein